MSSKIVSVKTFLAASAIGALLVISCQPSWAHGADVSALDTNGDGSISPQEAHEGAAKTFDRLDTKHTGKLTKKQVSPMSKAIREMARHDKDHMIDKDEYMAGVDAAFKEADPTGSGVLNAKALKTRAGKHFLELVE